MNRRPLPVWLLILAVVLAACSSGGEETAVVEATTTAVPTNTAAATDTPATEPSDDPGSDEPKVEPTVSLPTPAPEATDDGAAQPSDQPDPGAEGSGFGGSTMDNAMAGVPGDAAPYETYVTITDDTEAIQLDVPEEWAAQVDGRPYTDDQGRQLFDVRAAPDLEAFASTWTTPGVIVTASREVAQTENEVSLLDEIVDLYGDDCTYLGREPYDDGLYIGQFDVFDDCGGTGVSYVVVGAVPTSRAFVIRVQVQVTDERDLEALERVIQTFQIVGDV